MKHNYFSKGSLKLLSPKRESGLDLGSDIKVIANKDEMEEKMNGAK